MFDSERVQNIFHEDGSLRDIYVFETTVEDWQCVIDYFVSSNAPNTFRVDGELQPIPNRSTEIFEKTHNHHFMWSIEYQGLLLNSHFFSDSEIEFDLIPSDVKTVDNANHVVAFMSKLAQLTDKAVLLTPENCPESPLLRLNPNGSVTIC